MRESLLWGAAIGALVLGLFVLERFFPLRRATRPLPGRLLVNLTFAAVAFATVSLTVRPVAQATLDWGETPSAWRSGRRFRHCLGRFWLFY